MCHTLHPSIRETPLYPIYFLPDIKVGLLHKENKDSTFNVNMTFHASRKISVTRGGFEYRMMKEKSMSFIERCEVMRPSLCE